MRWRSYVNSEWALLSLYNTVLNIPDLLTLSSHILRTLNHTHYPTTSSSRRSSGLSHTTKRQILSKLYLGL
ncbi:hypothetical protein M422DRAFT_31085 [Sphaerobolus stellatus SS14]|uniref:Uncharacterized protein n=1 Tax=Sphaerobolus stellatus (strain SS14) TaxID=990650 RepID=A0A0C9VMD4_SPHS4|nr:hypothetical protein M422DRAFT_31085 [Sphaerobolus stellatus SS14]